MGSRDAKAAGMEATDVAAAASVPNYGHHPGVSSKCGRSVNLVMIPHCLLFIPGFSCQFLCAANALDVLQLPGVIRCEW